MSSGFPGVCLPAELRKERGGSVFRLSVSKLLLSRRTSERYESRGD